jgi:hypothetical protein
MFRSDRADEALAWFRKNGYLAPGANDTVWSMYVALACAKAGDLVTADQILQTLTRFDRTQLYRRISAEIEQISARR